MANSSVTLALHVSKWNAIRKCSYAICPAATARSPNSGKHPAERWWNEHRDKQEDTMWMEQLEKYVRRPMRQESTTTREGKDKHDRSASNAVRDGDSASH